MFLGVMRAGMHLRIATSALIYRKVSAGLVSICIRLSFQLAIMLKKVVLYDV